MKLAKEVSVLLAVAIIGLTGITTATERMVLGEMFTNTS